MNEDELRNGDHCNLCVGKLGQICPNFPEGAVLNLITLNDIDANEVARQNDRRAV